MYIQNNTEYVGLCHAVYKPAANKAYVKDIFPATFGPISHTVFLSFLLKLFLLFICYVCSMNG